MTGNPPRPHHLNLAVSGDVARTADFYRNLLGLTPIELPLPLRLPGDREALARSQQPQGDLVPILQPATLGRLAGRQRSRDVQNLLQALPRPLGRSSGSLG